MECLQANSPSKQQPKKVLSHVDPDSPQADDVRSRLMSISEAVPPSLDLKGPAQKKSQHVEAEDDVRRRLMSISYDIAEQPVEN